MNRIPLGMMVGVISMASILHVSATEEKYTVSTSNTGTVSSSGSIQPTAALSPQGSGAHMTEREMLGLGLAISKLKGEERLELIKIIRTYLTSKGVDLATSEVDIDPYRKGWDGSVKGNIHKQEMKKIKKNTQEEVKAIRKKAQEAIQEKRKAMQAKLKAKRSGGRATMQDFTFMK